jgi:hypothetical protein
VVSRFLLRHDMDLVVRGGKPVETGYEFFSKRQLVTLCSTSHYTKGRNDNQDGHKAAIMSVDETLLCSFQVRRAFTLYLQRINARLAGRTRPDIRYLSLHRFSPSRAATPKETRKSNGTPRNPVLILGSEHPLGLHGGNRETFGEVDPRVYLLPRQLNLHPTIRNSNWNCNLKGVPRLATES